MANHVQHQALNEALNEGVRSLQKWYDQVDGSSSPAYFICQGMTLLFHFTMQSCTDLSTLVLNPTVKDQYFQLKWSSEQYDTSMGQLEEVVSDLLYVFYILTLFSLTSTTLPQCKMILVSPQVCYISCPPERYSMLTPVLLYTVDPITPEPLFQYGRSHLQNAVQSFQQEDTGSGSPWDELHSSTNTFKVTLRSPQTFLVGGGKLIFI
jgi:hypothetical protein